MSKELKAFEDAVMARKIAGKLPALDSAEANQRDLEEILQTSFKAARDAAEGMDQWMNEIRAAGEFCIRNDVFSNTTFASEVMVLAKKFEESKKLLEETAKLALKVNRESLEEKNWNWIKG